MNLLFVLYKDMFFLNGKGRQKGDKLEKFPDLYIKTADDLN